MIPLVAQASPQFLGLLGFTYFVIGVCKVLRDLYLAWVQLMSLLKDWNTFLQFVFLEQNPAIGIGNRRVIRVELKGCFGRRLGGSVAGFLVEPRQVVKCDGIVGADCSDFFVLLNRLRILTVSLIAHG